MLQTDTIPTPGWWLVQEFQLDRLKGTVSVYAAFPFTTLTVTNTERIQGYTHDPAAVLAWVRDGVLP